MGRPRTNSLIYSGRKVERFRAEVFATYGRRCHWCGKPATTADHLTPRSVDPSRMFDVDNARPSCLSCNSARRATPAEEFATTMAAKRMAGSNGKGSKPEAKPVALELAEGWGLEVGAGGHRWDLAYDSCRLSTCPHHAAAGRHEPEP